MLSHIFHIHSSLAIIETTSDRVQFKVLGARLTDMDYVRFRRFASDGLLVEACGLFRETNINLCECRPISHTENHSGVPVLITSFFRHLKLWS